MWAETWTDSYIFCRHLLKLCIIALITQAVIAGKPNSKGECECACEKESILLHNVKELNFTRGLNTHSRRLPPIPQVMMFITSAKDSVFTHVSRWSAWEVQLKVTTSLDICVVSMLEDQVCKTQPSSSSPSSSPSMFRCWMEMRSWCR